MRLFVISLLCMGLVACESKKEATAKKSWHGSMRGLADSLMEIMPQLITGPAGIIPIEKDKLQVAVSRLQDYSQPLTDVNVTIPSEDPSLHFVAIEFRKKVDEVRELSRRGDHHQTRTALRDLTRYCVACHTRTRSGSSMFAKSMMSSTQNMSDLQKGRFFTALRQYERALIHYENALTNKEWANNNERQWNEGVIHLLTITVQVHNNPNLTLEMISQLFDSKAYPQELTKAARVWRQDAKEWDRMGVKKGDLQGITPLLMEAQKREKNIPHSGLILKLRALAKLNAYLKHGETDMRNEQAALYYSGLVTESLQALEFSDFPKTYFQACVQANPNSTFGQKCLRKL